MFKRIFSDVFKTYELKLGRWEHRNNHKTKEIKFLLANYDHCGDTICGKPQTIVDNVKQIQNKKN